MNDCVYSVYWAPGKHKNLADTETITKTNY